MVVIGIPFISQNVYIWKNTKHSGKLYHISVESDYMRENYFLNMIKSLRQDEEILLYENIISISETDAFETIEFLKSE